MIYSDDIRACNAIAQSGPDALARTVRFVLATIQQRLETVPEIMRDFEQHGSASRFAFGSKSSGLDFLRDNIAALDSAAHQALARDDMRLLLDVFLTVPGLGIVKAGFCAQLFAGKIGCIDTHNIKLYGIPLSSLKYSYTLQPETQHKKQRQYIELCNALGGSAALWSRWCDYVAQQRPANWASGRAVSRFHIDCVSGSIL